MSALTGPDHASAVVPCHRTSKSFCAMAATADSIPVDVLLPTVQDGLGLVRALTAELNVPAVAISIHGWVRGSALAAGAHRFLDKDSAPERLVAALRAAARYPRQMS